MSSDEERCDARQVKVRPTSWDPASARVALNVSLDACFVPTSTATSAAPGDGGRGEGGGGGGGGGAGMEASLPGAPAGCRVSLSHVVALDGVVDEEMRRRLLEAVTAPGWDEATPTPPAARWERRTADLYSDPGYGGRAPMDGQPSPPLKALRFRV
jgi:hypothetical protein